jgi:putative transcription factor
MSVPHQDFKEVVFTKQSTSNSASNRPHVEVSKEARLDQDHENVAHKRVGLGLGRQIQQARLAKRFSQKDLAMHLNVKPDIILAYENGKAIPNPTLLQKMRHLLQVKFST